MAEMLANRRVSVFQYRMDHLSRKSEEWKRRKCPIYDPGTGSNVTEESFLIPKHELYLRKVFSYTCEIVAEYWYVFLTGLQSMCQYFQAMAVLRPS